MLWIIFAEADKKSQIWGKIVSKPLTNPVGIFMSVEVIAFAV